MTIKLSDNARMLLSLFLPLYAIHCMEQVYFVYGNVLQEMAISPEMTGWLLSSFFIAIMACRTVGGWFLENLGIRRTLQIGSIVGFVGCSVLFVASFEIFRGSVGILFLGRVLSGASFGIYSIGIFSYQAITIPEHMRGAVFAIVISGGILPTATITPIGEWLLFGSHLRAYLALGPLLCVACWYFGSKLGTDEAPKRGRRGQWGSYGDLVRSRGFLPLVLTGSVVALIDASMVNISLLAAEKGVAASYFLASCSVAAVIVRVAGARLLNVAPRLVAFAPCGMLMTLAILLVSVVPSGTTFLISGALFGIGIGAAFPMFLALISDTLPQELRPKGMATALLLYDSGWFLTPLIVGYATAAFGVAGTFRLLSLSTLAILAVLQCLYWVPRFRAMRIAKDA